MYLRRKNYSISNIDFDYLENLALVEKMYSDENENYGATGAAIGASIGGLGTVAGGLGYVVHREKVKNIIKKSLNNKNKDKEHREQLSEKERKLWEEVKALSKKLPEDKQKKWLDFTTAHKYANNDKEFKKQVDKALNKTVNMTYKNKILRNLAIATAATGALAGGGYYLGKKKKK